MAPIDPTEGDADFPDWLSSSDAPGEPDLSELLAAAAAPPEAPPPAPPPPPPAPAPANPRPTGEPFLYGTVVAMGPQAAAGDVQIEHDVPPGLRVLATSPPVAARRRGTLIWRFARGAAGTKIPLRIQAVRLDGGRNAPLAQAVFRVSSTNRFTTSVPLVRPGVAVELLGPDALELGTSARLTLKVRNTGGCPLHGVAVRLTASGGFELLSPADIEFAEIPVRGEAAAALDVIGRVAGPGSVRAEVHAQPEATGTTEVAGEVTVSKLEPGFVAPPRWRVSHEQTVTAIVRNTGTAAARMVGVRVRVPAGWGVTGDEVFATVDEIAAAASFELPLTLTPSLPGTGTFDITAEDANGACEARLTAVAELAPADSHGILERFVQELGYPPGEDAAPAAAAGAPTRVQSGREHPHVVFSVAETDYAFPLNSVREIGRPPTATPLPNAPDWLVGVTSIRGDIVSMVDLGAFLDEAPSLPGRDRRLLIVTDPASEMSAGLLVDRVRGIRSIPPEQVRQPAAPVAARCSAYMAGVAVLDRRSVVVLAPGRLLPAPEFMPFGHG